MCTLLKFDTQNNAIPRYYTQNIQENLVNFDILRCPPQKPRRFNLVFSTYKVKNDTTTHILQVEENRYSLVFFKSASKYLCMPIVNIHVPVV